MENKNEDVDIYENKQDVISKSLSGPTDIIFCGNPGVGKSTLLSCISGCHFESGLSFGSGLTAELRFQTGAQNRDIRFADTPGLGDVKLAKVAAKAINKALEDASKNQRRVKIIFVVTSESGRIRPEDQMTINKVIGSITASKNLVKDNKFGVIVNKCRWLEKKALAEKGVKKIKAVFHQKTSINTFSTKYVIFLPLVDELELAVNGRHSFKNLEEFIGSIPGIGSIESVTKIDTRNIKQQLEEQEKKQKMRIEKLKAKMKLEQEKKRREMEKQRRAYEESVREHERNMERRRREQERARERRRIHLRRVQEMEQREREERNREAALEREYVAQIMQHGTFTERLIAILYLTS